MIANKEEKPVIYKIDATKTLKFAFERGKDCFAMHWHERFEILYIKKGQMEYTLGSQSGVAAQGEAVIIPPRLAHYGRAKTDVEYEVLMFDLRYFYNDTDICKNVLTAIFEGGAQYVEKTDNAKVTECILSLLSSESPLRTVSLVYLLLQLFIENGIMTLTYSTADSSMREVTKYIEDNFDKELSTDDLCREFGYSAGHFGRKFKKATGLTPMAYLKIYRLERAYKMIKQGDGRIYEIAQSCGFSDSNYFTRSFTAHYKHPPKYFK